MNPTILFIGTFSSFILIGEIVWLLVLWGAPARRLRVAYLILRSELQELRWRRGWRP